MTDTYYANPNEQTKYFDAFADAYDKCLRGGMDKAACVAAAELAAAVAVDALRINERLAAEARRERQS